MEEIDAYYALTQRVFNFLAPVYNVMTLPLVRVRDQVVDFANADTGSLVLDVATGTGQQAFAFAKRGYEVIAVDLTESMLEFARKHNIAGSVTFEVGDATHLRFEANTFDVTCISFALHDMPLAVREKVLKEMVRLTKVDGMIVIVDYALPGNRISKELIYHLITLYEGKYYKQFIISDLDMLLEKAGIKIVGKFPILSGAGRVIKGTPKLITFSSNRKLVKEVSLTRSSNRMKGENPMATTVRDPVCGMDIDPETAAGKSEYKGQTYYFCSPGCKRSFDKDPEKYLSHSEHEHHH